MIARLAKHLREERIVAPLPPLADDMHREDILEDEARQVVRRYDIAELHEQARFLARRLPRRGGHEVAVLLRMVPAVALADDEHKILCQRLRGAPAGAHREAAQDAELL